MCCQARKKPMTLYGRSAIIVLFLRFHSCIVFILSTMRQPELFVNTKIDMLDLFFC